MLQETLKCNMKVVAVIQARMGSTRLPGKTLMKLSKYTLLDTVINSVKQNSFVDEFIVVTSKNKEDDLIEKHCGENNISFIRGDSANVLSRFITVAKKLDPNDIIVRVTADNPLNNKNVSQELFEKHLTEKNEYTYVKGLSHIVYEFLNASTVLKLGKVEDLKQEDKEHVTMYLRKKDDLFKTGSISSTSFNLNPELDKLLTVDSIKDFDRFQEMKKEIDLDSKLEFEEIYKWLLKNPTLY